MKKTSMCVALMLALAAQINAMPANTIQADMTFKARRANLVKAWVMKFRNTTSLYGSTYGYPPWSSAGKDALREMGAGMYVFAHPNEFEPRYLGYLSGLDASSSYANHLSTYQTRVLHYLVTSVSHFANTGTEMTGRTGDFDFLQKEILSLVYSNLDNPGVLTNDMVWRLFTQNNVAELQDADQVTTGGILSPIGHDYDSYVISPFGVDMGVKVKWRTSETENHILMMYSWKYLVNNYAEWVASLPATHPRYDSRIAALYNGNVARYKNGAAMNTWILKILGRPVQRGMFETDSKAYESISYSALLNYYSYAAALFPNDPNRIKIKIAAQNALDYLSGNFAFQSLEGKRNSPMRRHLEYAPRVGLYANDYIHNMLGVLSGAYVFNDNIGEADYLNGAPAPAEPWKVPYHYTTINQEGGFALWTALSDYRIPSVVEDFLLHKYNGWFAKTQSKYWKSEYGWDWSVAVSGTTPNDPTAQPSNYFGTPSGSFKPVSQNVFVTPDFCNTGAGVYEKFFEDSYSIPVTGPGFSTAITFDKSDLKEFNALAKPNMLITKGDVGYAGVDGDNLSTLGSQILLNQDGPAIYNSWIMGAYKSFALGVKNSSTVFPTGWSSYLAHTFNMGPFSCNVYDMRTASTNLKGYYLIMATNGSSGGGMVWREVVPGSMYASATALRDWMTANNPTNTTGNYIYKTASSKDQITLAWSVPFGIRKVVDKNGTDVGATYAFPSNARPETVPLITAWQVDNAYNFTGYKYAETPSTGRIIFRNPHYYASEATVDINGTDYLNPTTNNPFRPTTVYVPEATPSVISALF